MEEYRQRRTESETSYENAWSGKNRCCKPLRRDTSVEGSNEVDQAHREMWLLKHLLQRTIMEELNVFLKSDSSISLENNVALPVLSSVYAKIFDVPIFRSIENCSNIEFKNAVDTFLTKLPELNTCLLAYRGIGIVKDITNIIASPISVFFTTPQQKEDYAADNYASPVLNRKEHEHFHDKLLQMAAEHGRERRLFLETFSLFLVSLESGRDSISLMVDSIVSSHSLIELPQHLRRLFEQCARMAARRVEALCSVDKSLKKAKKSFKRFPKRALIGVLRLGSNGSVVSGLLKLFFSPGLSGKSFFQSFCEESFVDIANEKNILKKLRRKLPAAVVSKASGYASACFNGYCVVPRSAETVHIALIEPTPGPDPGILVSEDIASSLNDKQCRNVHNYIVHEENLLIKMKLSNILGSDAVIDMLKCVIEAGDRLLREVFYSKHNGLIDFVVSIFDSMEEIFNAASDATITLNIKKQRYWKAVVRMHEEFFIILRSALLSDGGRNQFINMIFFILECFCAGNRDFDLERVMINTAIEQGGEWLASTEMSNTPRLLRRQVASDGVTDYENNDGISTDEKNSSIISNALKQQVWMEVDEGIHFHRYFKKSIKKDMVEDDKTHGPPVLPNVEMLFESFRKILYDRMSSSSDKGSIRRLTLSAVEMLEELSLMSPEDQNDGVSYVLTHIEISSDRKTERSLSLHGFKKLERPLVAGILGSSGECLWFKTSPLKLKTSSISVYGCLPITSLAISTCSGDMTDLKANGFIKLSNNFGSSSQAMYLWYKRGETDIAPIVDVQLRKYVPDSIDPNEKYSSIAIDIKNSKLRSKTNRLWYKRIEEKKLS